MSCADCPLLFLFLCAVTQYLPNVVVEVSDGFLLLAANIA